MQDSYNARLTETFSGASSMSEKKAECSRCQCCNAAIPTAGSFAPAVNAAPISCIVCGHQNASSDPFAPSSRTQNR